MEMVLVVGSKMAASTKLAWLAIFLWLHPDTMYGVARPWAVRGFGGTVRRQFCAYAAAAKSTERALPLKKKECGCMLMLLLRNERKTQTISRGN